MSAQYRAAVAAVGRLAICAVVAAWACANERGVEPVSAGVRHARVPSSDPGARVRGKGHAPVLIDGHVDGATATLTLTFVAAAEDASVELSGTEGLRVLSSLEPLRGARVEAGHAVHIEVDLDPATQRGNLVVTAHARYGGRRQAVVRSFSVGAAVHPARSVDATQTVHIGGRLLRLTPSEQP